MTRLDAVKEIERRFSEEMHYARNHPDNARRIAFQAGMTEACEQIAVRFFGVSYDEINRIKDEVRSR